MYTFSSGNFVCEYLGNLLRLCRRLQTHHGQGCLPSPTGAFWCLWLWLRNPSPRHGPLCPKISNDSYPWQSIISEGFYVSP